MSSEGIVTGLSNPNEPSSANLCTLYDLREGVFDFDRDTERVFVTEAAVTRWINEAYVDLNARLRLNQASDEGTTSSAGILTVPTDFLELISLWFGADPVIVVDDAVFESYLHPAATTLDNDVTLIRFFEGQFETYPVADTLDYTLRYVATVEQLIDPEDQPLALTPELCVRLRKYALAEMYQKEGDTRMAEQALAEYLEGLPGRPRLGHRMRPAPVSLIPEAGPFG